MEERTAERGWPIFGAKLKACRHIMFKSSPLFIRYGFAIINPFAWVVNTCSSEKHCSTSMARSLSSGRLAHKYAAVQGWTSWSRAHRKFKFYRELLNFVPWRVTRSPPIGKRIWVGSYNNVEYSTRRSLGDYSTIFTEPEANICCIILENIIFRK